ncbi:GDSL-type esterase/lipase family protein [Sporosarcina sp. ACRSM]|uniref:GDSL-type esterase/lipase family protein n=1 Tax=Sporosarcina sp. ACRSM TaxID=2918216 RepID=UPI001EF6D2F0|nr:GDSL-type esterase/lipase family protein [Sporosarcina sp. ACRSM]MCG7334515.1 GDSL-type esterase/lipase family protein [Sporosarcina sp. ACRSM]
MRRVFMLLIVFSLLLSSCQPEDNRVSQPFSTRHESGFSEWSIPGYFIPKKIHVIGLGDSLTQGVGDELKKSGYFGRVTDKMKEWKGVLDVDSANLAKRGRRSDQLIKQLEESEIQSAVEEADLIYLTIGGNDIMKVVKANLFNLKVEPFYRELGDFENRLDELFTIIRTLNGDAIIVVGGLYNPISIVTDEANEFDEILEDWNEAIEIRAIMDGKACFVPVTDLFDSNVNMVYHTDFFHPNAKGYDGMANRFLESIQKCGLLELSEGQLDM